jgi:hypothetical protein
MFHLSHQQPKFVGLNFETFTTSKTIKMAPKRSNISIVHGTTFGTRITCMTYDKNMLIKTIEEDEQKSSFQFSFNMRLMPLWLAQSQSAGSNRSDPKAIQIENLWMRHDDSSSSSHPHLSFCPIVPHPSIHSPISPTLSPSCSNWIALLVVSH